jgi:hypothetical protein
MPYGLRERLIVCGQQDAPGRELDNEVEPIILLNGRCEPDDLIRGGFNWSSQHLDRGGVYGQASGVDEGVDGQGADEVAGGAVAASRCRAVVLA